MRVPAGTASEWAGHRIVEVQLNISDGSLRFVRLRPDRSRANTFEEAQTIIDAQMSGVGELAALSALEFAAMDPCGWDASFRDVDDAPPGGDGDALSGFTVLAVLHRAVKRMLFQLHGGVSIVDIACGGGGDLDAAFSGGANRVVAIDCDPASVARARQRAAAVCAARGVDLDCISLVCADVTQPLGDDCFGGEVKSFDAAFCHFALHYCWQSEAATDMLLANVVPALKEGARFVVTWMDAARLRDEHGGTIQLFDTHGVLQFEVGPSDGDAQSDGSVVNVFVRSIGRAHDEILIEEGELIRRFAKCGLAHVGTMPFESLAALHPRQAHALSQAERTMSSLYRADIFVVQRGGSPSGSEVTEVAFLPQVPGRIYKARVLFGLSVPELVNARCISRAWRTTIDTVSKEAARDDPIQWRARMGVRAYQLGYDVFLRGASSLREVVAAAPTAGLYARMGGDLVGLQRRIIQEENRSRERRALARERENYGPWMYRTGYDSY